MALTTQQEKLIPIAPNLTCIDLILSFTTMIYISITEWSLPHATVQTKKRALHTGHALLGKE